ncbi:MAG: DNA-directed RNA polymerase subunit L [Thermoplasmata archaeon]|jgi:DNA-directed RNA polymerase subunit L|nr:DNA-directed RNA polymerase subunit L [Thermoplasmata archaeon]RLF59932.1 MAG: DNA-directed RNA polymerase subunit L [Thermoplasmata archaeon]
MEIKIKKESAKEMEFEVISEKTILNPLKEKLLEYEEVEYAEWNVPHPLVANPEFYVRVSKGKAKDVVKKAVRELKEEIEELMKQLEEKE